MPWPGFSVDTGKRGENAERPPVEHDFAFAHRVDDLPDRAAIPV